MDDYVDEWDCFAPGGWLDWLGSPSAGSIIRREIRSAERHLDRLTSDLASKQHLLDTQRLEIQALHRAAKPEQVREVALDYRVTKLAYQRLSSQRRNLIVAINKLRQLHNQKITDKIIITIYQGMVHRAETMKPERFSEIMTKLDEMQMKNLMTEEMFREHMIDADEQDADLEREEYSEPELLRELYAELGITLPNVPLQDLPIGKIQPI